MCFQTDRIDTSVRADTGGDFAQRLGDVYDLIIDCNGRTLSTRQFKAFRDTIDRDYSFRAEKVGAANGKLSHRTTAPNGDRVAGLYAAVFRRLVSGGKDIGKEKRLFSARSEEHTSEL